MNKVRSAVRSALERKSVRSVLDSKAVKSIFDPKASAKAILESKAIRSLRDNKSIKAVSEWWNMLKSGKKRRHPALEGTPAASRSAAIPERERSDPPPETPAIVAKPIVPPDTTKSGDTYDSIFTIHLPTPDVRVESLVWDRLKAVLPASYALPDAATLRTIHPMCGDHYNAIFLRKVPTPGIIVDDQVWKKTLESLPSHYALPDPVTLDLFS